ncbi:MAG: PAS domain S-box protein [Okeania sp. SIO2F4]|uniref:sensor histidine kinase n=1 Tax=Okeania sp. SIO2F4 TaxID=2607790 RepID=UPI0014293896|nr:ATP-binding protein [Okeania sp. SIO2F4]NES02898.1 PAS domain S-box protein [Okeania sp. SIO2F4]
MLRYFFLNNLDRTLLLQVGDCWRDPPQLVWLQTTSNILITFAFYSIAALIIYFIHKRQDIERSWIIPILAICILSYATTHLIETWSLWYPSDLLSGLLQAVTAIISILIASIIVLLIPTALTIPSPNQLQLVNAELASEIQRRQQAEKLVQTVNGLLEQRVENRTRALTWLNNKLRQTVKEQVQVKEKLQLSQFAIERSADAIFWIAKDGKLIYVNDAACHSLGYSPEELLSMTIHEINSDFPKNSWSLHWNLLKKCGHLKIEAYHFNKHNKKFPVEITLNHLEFKGKEYQCIFARDISDRKKAEIALRKSEARERNKAEQLETVLKELRQTQAQLIQTEKMSSLGQLVAGIAHEINNPISFIYGNISYSNQYIKDILELIDLYQQNYPTPDAEIQSHIEEIELGFVKEDLPKIMSSMQSGAERIRSIILSLRNFARLDESEKKLVNIHDGINSTLLILKNRLNLVTGLATGIKSEEIQIIKNYGDLPLVECYPGHLNQVFMNVLNNAIDSLEISILSNSWIAQNKQLSHTVLDMKKWSHIHSKTTLNISSKITNNNRQTSLENLGNSRKYWVVNSNKNSNQILDLAKQNHREKLKKPTISISTEIVDNNFICIRIGDNGLGMNEQISKQIFDPFFTTKPVGKGTGLGLAISYKIIVEKHGGNIQCNPALGEGCEFVIQIPVKLKKQEKVTSFQKAG